jgi:catechol 2,3-dioxygenase-like lactoylglutathione lyase family enzyme
MNWTLEVVVVPVSDVDRAKAFYAEKVGFHVDHDTAISGGPRIVPAASRTTSLPEQRYLITRAARLTAEPR